MKTTVNIIINGNNRHISVFVGFHTMTRQNFHHVELTPFLELRGNGNKLYLSGYCGHERKIGRRDGIACIKSFRRHLEKICHPKSGVDIMAHRKFWGKSV